MFDRIAAWLLFIVGVLTLGTGVYFLFLRPAMLPEDVRLTGIEPQSLSPGMVEWLRIVFRTWGGFIAAFGILILSVASYILASRPAWLSWGVALSLPVAHGRFLASNVTIRSDFIWFVGGLFGLALLTALGFAFRIYRSSDLKKHNRWGECIEGSTRHRFPRFPLSLTRCSWMRSTAAGKAAARPPRERAPSAAP